MRAEMTNVVNAIGKSLELLGQRLDFETAPYRLEEFNALIEDPALWDDQDRAQKLMRDRQLLIDSLAVYEGIKLELSDNLEMIELAELENDSGVIRDSENALKNLKKTAAKKELEALLGGEADSNDTFLEINSGAGGTESCDWALMLARMYIRWAEKKGYKVELQSETAGEEVGIKSASYKIIGHNAYGWLKSESGVHRLVRISPFDAAAKRHTSFSSVWVYPVVDDNIDIEVQSKDIRIDTYRSSGAGGQHVNTTDSAVRITHIPSGIVVSQQDEKSQHKNRAKAMKILLARLYEAERQKQQDERSSARKDQVGSGDRSERIRTYNFPQGRVSDHRINLTLHKLEKVLQGEALDELIDGLIVEDRMLKLALNGS